MTFEGPFPSKLFCGSMMFCHCPVTFIQPFSQGPLPGEAEHFTPLHRLTRAYRPAGEHKSPHRAAGPRAAAVWPAGAGGRRAASASLKRMEAAFPRLQPNGRQTSGLRLPLRSVAEGRAAAAGAAERLLCVCSSFVL